MYRRFWLGCSAFLLLLQMKTMRGGIVEARSRQLDEEQYSPSYKPTEVRGGAEEEEEAGNRYKPTYSPTSSILEEESGGMTISEEVEKYEPTYAPTSQKSGERKRVACIGNSLTNGAGADVGYPEQLADMLEDEISVVRYSRGGRTAADVDGRWYLDTSQYESLVNDEFDAIIALFGTNDAQDDLWVSDSFFVDGYVELVTTLVDEYNRDFDVFFLGLPPPVLPGDSRWQDLELANEDMPDLVRSEVLPALQDALDSTEVILIDFSKGIDSDSDYADKVHLNDDGYKVMARTAKSALEDFYGF